MLSITAKLTDIYGNPVSGHAITFAALSNGGTPYSCPASSNTDATGQTTVSYTCGAVADSMNYCVVNSAGVVGTTVIIYVANTATKIVPNPNPMSVGAGIAGLLNIDTEDGGNYNAPPAATHMTFTAAANVNLQYSSDGITWLPLNTAYTIEVNSSGYALMYLKSPAVGSYNFNITDNNGTGPLTTGNEVVNVTTGYYIHVSPAASLGTINIPAGAAINVTAYVTDQNGDLRRCRTYP